MQEPCSPTDRPRGEGTRFGADGLAARIAPPPKSFVIGIRWGSASQAAVFNVFNATDRSPGTLGSDAMSSHSLLVICPLGRGSAS